VKYYIWCQKDNGIIQYTYYVLKYLVELNGHEISSINNCDFILFSICDVSQIISLKYIKKMHKNKKIIIGGHFAIFFKLCILFSDYVNVGQGFEFFKCQTEEEIKGLRCIYYEGCNKIIEPSILIEWDKIPLCKITKNGYYYWNSVGCKNKCKFCLTSWINKYQQNNKDRIKYIKRENERKNINYISNENDNLIEIKEQRKSIMLKDFLNIKKHFCNYYRVGLEFALEENRKEQGKYFTDEMLIESILKAIKEKVRIQFFCIAGYEPKKAWYNLFSILPAINKGWEIKFKFTNLEYQMFTPIYKELENMNIDYYMGNKDREYIWNKYLKNIIKCGRIETIKYPAYALWRTGMTNSINRQQFDIFYNLRNEKSKEKLRDAIFENKIYNNDYSGEVKFWYQKEQV
jgi:hypothetical protein